MAWTHFWDMHSGGRQKLKWQHIYIEAPEAKAITAFQTRFGRNLDNVTCNCCGPDYSVKEYKTIFEATGFQRNVRKYSIFTSRAPITLKAYRESGEACFITAKELAQT